MTWLVMLAAPEILLALFLGIVILFAILLRSSTTAIIVLIIVGLVAIFPYWYVRHGETKSNLKRMNELCADESTIVINKTVTLSDSYWDDDGGPSFYTQVIYDREGVRYEMVRTYGEVDDFGISETIEKVVNANTGELYGVGKSYRYFGSWFTRKMAYTPRAYQSCYWGDVGDSKYGDYAKGHKHFIESWVFVPANGVKK